MIKQLSFLNKKFIIMSFVFFTPLPVFSMQNFCFNESGLYFNIDPALLRSIAQIESNFNPKAIGKNYDSKGNLKSLDYGIMQINQLHIPKLIDAGIITSEMDLIKDPCLNIKIGAWILYEHFSRCGVNWACLGTYNAGFSEKNKEKRNEYALKVYRVYNMQKLTR